MRIYKDKLSEGIVCRSVGITVFKLPVFYFHWHTGGEHWCWFRPRCIEFFGIGWCMFKK
jgi:hypothetical protein